MPDDWSSLPSGCANLMQIIRPRTLPKTFPFPHSKGEEQRDRPAYYYTQSSVIPYRIKDGNLQILVVHSSSKRHWVVPKGIHDPGLTAQQSAAVEAFEEAGVEGTVMEEALGSYRYAKWGSECTVTVFGLQVERMIDEQHWEENHRGRKWLSVNEAIGFLKQQELGPLVEKLAKRIMG
jgi:phosphohistidine phosphatase